MPDTPPPDSDLSGGMHFGNVAGNVTQTAGGDIVGGNKITITQISAEAVTQRPLITASPYRGLDRFEDRDKDLFFGRDQLIASLLARVDAANVILVLGASGSGKSSVVHAGLLPKRAQSIGPRFRYFRLVPDVHPFESLRIALVAAGFSSSQTGESLDPQPETPARLIRGLKREGDQWLFFIDQFEEIFTRSDEGQRKNFMAALLTIAAQPDASIKVVLAMRADFLDRFSPFPEFREIIEKPVFVADMHPDELRLAIEQPAAWHGVVFEQGLVEEIMKDVQGQAGSLPLLQYTLDLLWQEEVRADGLADRHLNTKAYRQLGGVRGALQKRADEIYAAFGDGEDAKKPSRKQEVVRQIFLRLVDLAGESSNDAGWRPVRRRAPMAMFTTAQEQEILSELINQKLLVSNREGDDATVEVAHEALFTSWERLKNWIEAGKQVIFARNRLGDDARRWQRRQQEDPSGAEDELLGGSRLAQALDMRARGDFTAVVGGLGESETQFLDASAALRDRRQQEEQERQQRELEAAQRLAATRKVATDRLRVGLTAAVVLMVVALFALKRSVDQESKAKKAEAEAEKASVEADFDAALMAQQNADVVSPQTLAHLARALRIQPDARPPREYLCSLLRDFSWYLPNTEPVRVEGEITAVHFDSESPRVLTVSDRQTARLWDARSGGLLGKSMTDGRMSAASFSHDGRWVLTTSNSFMGHAQAWDAVKCERFGMPTSNGEGVLAADISPDGQRIVASTYGSIDVWRSEDRQKAGKLPLDGSDVTAVRFSSDGQLIVTCSQDNTARVWKVEGGDPVTPPLRHEGRIVSAEFSGDGHKVITASMDQTARVWNSENGKPIGKPLRHEGGVVAASFNENGRRIVTVCSDKTVRVWDADSNLPLSEPLRHKSKVVATSFSSDGGSILTGCEDQTAWVWGAESGAALGETVRPDDKTAIPRSGVRFDIIKIEGQKYVQDKAKVAILPVEESTTDAVLSPDGRWIVTTSDTAARVWNVADRTAKGEPMPHEGGVVAASLSADGRWVVLTSRDSSSRVWNTSNGKPRGEPLQQEAAVFAVDVSLDGQRVVTASADQTVRLWDVASGKPLREPLRFERTVQSATFSPDGRRIFTVTDDDTAHAWDITAADLAAPPWLCELAEALGGIRLKSDGARIPPDKNIWQVRNEFMEKFSKDDADWSRFGRWFFMRGPKRTISPDSTITVGEADRLRANMEKARP